MTRISLIPPLLNTITGGGGGGFHGKKKNFTVSQLRALATHTPSLGCVSQRAWQLDFAQIGGAIF